MFKKLRKWIVRFVQERNEERMWRQDPVKMVRVWLSEEKIEKQLEKQFDELKKMRKENERSKL